MRWGHASSWRRGANAGDGVTIRGWSDRRPTLQGPQDQSNFDLRATSGVFVRSLTGTNPSEAPLAPDW